MTGDFRYRLENGSRKFRCPQCGQKRFVRYVDTLSGDYLPMEYGRCDREINCGYHLNPYCDGYVRFNDGQTDTKKRVNNKNLEKAGRIKQTPGSVTYIAAKIYEASLKDHTDNYFALWLNDRFGPVSAQGLIDKYKLGTSDHWFGSTIFWQIDQQERIRTGKIMLYDPTSGKRVKEPYNYITWVHKIISLPEFELQQCLFGEHLLSDEPIKPVALVESEKTAMIASLYFSQMVWLATGGFSNLSLERCRSLEGRNVILFPDLGGYEKWNKRASEISQTLSGVRFIVSDFLEKNASEYDKSKGFDLADYLIRFDWQSFREDKSIPMNPELNPKSAKGEKSDAS